MWELWARSSHRTDSIMKPGNSKAPLSNLGEAEIEEAEQEKLRLEVLVILLGAGIWVGRENPHRYWVHPWWNSAIWSGPFSVPSRVLLLLCFSIISPCRVAFCEHCSPTFRTNSKNPVFHAWLHALQIKTVSSQTGLLAASVWIVMKRLFECSQSRLFLRGWKPQSQTYLLHELDQPWWLLRHAPWSSIFGVTGPSWFHQCSGTNLEDPGPIQSKQFVHNIASSENEHAGWKWWLPVFVVFHPLWKWQPLDYHVRSWPALVSPLLISCHFIIPYSHFPFSDFGPLFGLSMAPSMVHERGP